MNSPTAGYSPAIIADTFEDFWKSLTDSVAGTHHTSALSLAFHLLIAGLCAIYISYLYKKCSRSPSDIGSVARVLPILAIVTTSVFSVVKSSPSLSLGLVGALSIVRFRAAIKDPEELVYLFLTIGVGLALGAEEPLLAVALVGVSSIFILWSHLTGRSRIQQRLLLTITGESEKYFSDTEGGVLSVVETVCGEYTLQRFDVEDGRGQMRIILGETHPKHTAGMVTKIREKLPECDLSYVDLNTTL